MKEGKLDHIVYYTSGDLPIAVSATSYTLQFLRHNFITIKANTTIAGFRTGCKGFFPNCSCPCYQHHHLLLDPMRQTSAISPLGCCTHLQSPNTLKAEKCNSHPYIYMRLDVRAREKNPEQTDDWQRGYREPNNPIIHRAVIAPPSPIMVNLVV